MDAIINDWREVERFRGKLRDTIEDLETQMKRTDRAIEDVAKTWKDNQFIKFHEGFNEDKDKIKPLCKAIGEFEDQVLYDLQKILEKYSNLL